MYGGAVCSIYGVGGCAAGLGSSGSDVNGDGITNKLDLLVAISQWGDCPERGHWSCKLPTIILEVVGQIDKWGHAIVNH